MKERTKNMMKMAIILLLIAGSVMFLYWNNKALVVTTYEYQNKDLPKSFNGYRIVQVSDLQSEYFGQDQENLLTVVEHVRPDLIVFTGDLLDRNHTNYEAARIAMEGLVAIAPVCYVNGNHEMALEEETIQAFYEELSQMGVTVLFDRQTSIIQNGETINVLGLSEYTIFACKNNERSNQIPADKEMLQEALAELEKDVKTGEFTILLTHEPQYLEQYASAKIDLVFAGHAHGGQIRLPFTDGLYAPGQGVLPKLASGLHTSGNTSLIISRGLGNSTFPLRIFNRPEIVTVTLWNGNN